MELPFDFSWNQNSAAFLLNRVFFLNIQLIRGKGSFTIMFVRCNVALAHQEAAQEDPQGSEEGGLYWSLASQQDPVHGAQGGSEGLPPQDWDQQEDLQDGRGIQDEGREGEWATLWVWQTLELNLFGMICRVSEDLQYWFLIAFGIIFIW